MTESFSFEDLEFLTVGTLGPRGERVFYLQGRGDGELVSLRLEKQQVAGLADYLERLLQELPAAPSSDPSGDLSLREPVVSSWTVGAIGVAFQSYDERMIIIAEELTDDEQEPAQARFVLRLDQVANLIERARTVVDSGRPPCPFCGQPLSPRFGGWCVCSN